MSSSVSRLLVTGASGFLGWHLCRLAQPSWEVHGTYHRHPLQGLKIKWHAIDLTDLSTVQAWLVALSPEAIIHTAALSQPNRCEEQPDLSYAINVEVTHWLAQFCGDRQIPFVFTSTDQVFDGQSAPYCEEDIPRPINTYGRHKAKAEQGIRQVHPSATICRMPLLYGPPTPVAECFLPGFIRTLAARQPLRLFTDEFRTPAYVEDAAKGLLLALAHSVDFLHLAGPERISRYDFGLRMAEIFDLNRDLILPSRQVDVSMLAARPADVSSSYQRAFELGYRPRRVVNGLIAAKQWISATLDKD